MIIFYLFLVLLGIRTNLQCQIWHDSISFWNRLFKSILITIGRIIIVALLIFSKNVILCFK